MRANLNTRALAVAVALALVATMALAASASALPGRFWGVMPQATPTADQFQRLQRGGVKSVRVPIAWHVVQPQRNGPLDWSGFDELIERTARKRLEVLPFFTGAPKWAVNEKRVPGGQGLKASARLPVSGNAAGAWRNLLRQAVLRYGPKGSYWRENPGVPKRPIRAWQIWNEPNFRYFVAKPNAAQYGKLVKISSGIIKRTDPKAQVVLAGMFALPSKCKKLKRPLDPCASDFLEQMYKRTPGVKSRFDGVALHPYSSVWQHLSPAIEEIRTVMKKNRDAGKGIWITELGWSSKPPEPKRNAFAKGVNGQRNQLKGAFSLLKRMQAKWRIKRVYWFSVDDQEGSCNFCDGSGLFSDGFKPKKSWYAYVRFAGGQPR